MPSTHFWAVTNQGRVYTLSTSGSQWEELPYCGMEFKRVTAVDWCTWGIGGDHQMYVYVVSTDVPIRFKEVAYENQRWNPKEGYCPRLLPTDRKAWSSEDGVVARYRERVKLPTLSWQWEGDWRVEHNFDGQAADPEGWMYAIDFPASYGKEKSWLSYVRRRKWTRLRRYVSTNHWANVPSIHDDPVLEPFIDVAIGGQDVPGGNGDTLAVWTVTVLGRIMFRTEVSACCPEGEQWEHIPTPQGGEVNQLSVGPTGLVWAVTWNGCALVRLGVSRTKITGLDWAEVPPPNEQSKLLQVSVGINSVWVITRDNKVWFRKGIVGSKSGISVEFATGSGWVEMVGEMSLLSVGPNDQVWALSSDERKSLYFRTAVTPHELSGKMWRPICLPRQTRAESFRSSSDECIPKENSDNASNDMTMKPTSIGPRRASSTLSEKEVFDKPLPTDLTETVEPAPIKVASSEDLRTESVKSVSSFASSNKGNVVFDLGGQSSHGSSPRASFSSSIGPAWLSADDTGYYDDSCVDFSWAWISGGGCLVHEQSVAHWFGSGMFSQQSVFNEPWRKEISRLLMWRHEHEVQSFPEYEQAIDKTSWITTGKAQVLVEGRQWLDCKLELERTGAEHGFECATLRCFGCGGSYDWQKVVIGVNDVTCIVIASDRHKPILAIYTAARTLEHEPIRLAFPSDTELEDWISLLNTTTCELRGIRGTPSLKAMWSLTIRGDIFTHDSDKTTHPSEMFWRQLGGHLHTVETCSAGVVWGIGYNHRVWVYTGGWGGGVFKGMDSSGSNVYPMHDVRCMYIYENQRWNPLTGFSHHRLPTDRYVWSDKSGRRECTKENTKLPSMHWQWITDWMIDFNITGGVDHDGWQYAKDFPMSYHGYKGLADYVRRRRWFRKCKHTTTGPWEELNSVALLDVSLQVDHSGCPNTVINLWAVSVKGEVLCRMGVNKCCPQGVHWEHVPLEQPAQSVSVGGGNEVWVVTKSGGAFLRHGISSQVPTGTVWFSVAPPERGSPLRRISAGPTTVWAVDCSGSVWFRQEIMPVFPEGTSWKYVCGNIRNISVGPFDQVWGIADSLGTCTGVVCRRVGITRENKIGNGWEYGIGGGWHHISVRGFVVEPDLR